MSRKRAIGLHERSTRFLLDTNVFIAAAKRGWTRTTDLVLRLVEGKEILIANEALIGEYRKYAGILAITVSFCLISSCRR